MSEIPVEVMREARRIYDLPIYEDASLNSLVSNRSQDYVLVAISRAILAEREACAKILDEMAEKEAAELLVCGDAFYMVHSHRLAVLSEASKATRRR